MIGVTLRSVATVAFGVFAASLMTRVLSPMIDVMDAPDSMLVNAFSQISEHAPAIIVLSAVFMFVAAGAARSSGGGY